MKRVIVDYKKLTNEILSMLVEKYPDGYGDDDIIRFKNAKNETVEALEVRTEDTIYLVKVSTRLASTMENFDEEEEFNVEEITPHIEITEEEEEEEEDVKNSKNRTSDDDSDEENDDNDEDYDEEYDEDYDEDDDYDEDEDEQK